jgi:cell division protein FtsW
MILFARIDYRIWQNGTPTMMLLALGFLVMVLVVGDNIKGASRWVRFGPINFQPSELAKYAVVFHVAATLARKKLFLEDWRRVLVPLLGWVGSVIVLIAIQPNMSTAGVVFTIVMVMFFLGDLPLRQLGVIVGAGLVGGGLFLVSAEYRMRRLLSWVGSSNADEAVSYQGDQALIAFGNGGITGVGPGQSRQRDWFLPESYGDFIFSIVGEEYGFIGVTVLVLAFALIMWRGFNVVKKAPDTFGRLLAAGITTTLAIYAFVNAGVTCGLLPTTGLPMPFISYGGSSVFFSAIAVGVLLNISSQAGVWVRPRLKAAANQGPLQNSHE